MSKKTKDNEPGKPKKHYYRVYISSGHHSKLVTIANTEKRTQGGQLEHMIEERYASVEALLAPAPVRQDSVEGEPECPVNE